MINECMNMRNKRIDEKPCGMCEYCIQNHEGHETIDLGESGMGCITCESRYVYTISYCPTHPFVKLNSSQDSCFRCVYHEVSCNSEYAKKVSADRLKTALKQYGFKESGDNV